MNALRGLVLTAVSLAICCGAQAQAPVATAQPWPGTLTLAVDATDVARRIYRVHETIPVKPGRLVLDYPQWVPGHHSPEGHIEQMVGLQISAAGRPIAWLRDPLDPHAFIIEVPAGASRLDIDFQRVTPVRPRTGRVVMTDELLHLQWHSVLLYPAGRADSGIDITASVKLPDGWEFGSALEVEKREASNVAFKTVSVETLIDSPLMAGKYFRRLDLDPDAGTAHRAPVFVDVVADAPSQLEVTPEQLAAHLALVTQATRLFASRHFAHYDFLLAISDRIGGIGREHHQSTEIAVRSGYFVDWGQAAFARDVLPHEFTHSWNGKFRRPFDLATPNTNTPMQDSLLWMYEGQTQYWGVVLSARSGLMSNDDVRDTLADIAATAESRSGRVWRNLQDTTNTPLFTDNYAEGHDWSDWQRGADYYDEMALVWLEADMVIRSASKGQRSLDDFARAFLGPMAGRSDRDFAVTTYRFEDVVAALDGVQHYDWTRFLRERLDTHAANWRATGLELAGWRLTWSDKPNARTAARAKRYEYDDFVYSIGVGIDRDGQLSSVRWNSPAFEARLTTSARVIAVNGEAYKPALLSQAIRDAHDKGSPIELLIRDGDHYKTVPIDWKGGLRYPKLERIDGRDDGLAMVLAPKS